MSNKGLYMEVDFKQIVSNIRRRTYKYLGSGSGMMNNAITIMPHTDQ